MTEHLVYRPSSYTSDGSNCVEVAVYETGVSVRDSKHREGPTVEFTHAQWEQFVCETIAGRDSANVAVEISVGDLTLEYDGVPKVTCWHWRSLATGAELHFTEGEQTAFLRGARNGEFTYPTAPNAPTAALSAAS